ncbi:hypothetical protein M6B38_248985 [Iris pallida]|uniref:Uncharacterized protein n=1 Tax=Iris pallida TaxID=29817 RepID=A0AAX6DFI3_IRIPA|nr:hypothetical protein M6B38_248985 [Iris pallida]
MSAAHGKNFGYSAGRDNRIEVTGSAGASIGNVSNQGVGNANEVNVGNNNGAPEIPQSATPDAIQPAVTYSCHCCCNCPCRAQHVSELPAESTVQTVKVEPAKRGSRYSISFLTLPQFLGRLVTGRWPIDRQAR